MARGDFTEDQLFELGQLEAPLRAARIEEAFEQRLQSLRDWGFMASNTEGGACVTLGALTVVTAFCESDAQNADMVCNFVSGLAAPGTFTPETIFVDDKSQTCRVALEQLDRALAILREHRHQINAPDVPMGWAFASD